MLALLAAFSALGCGTIASGLVSGFFTGLGGWDPGTLSVAAPLAWTCASALFTLTAAALLLVILRPVPEIHDTHLKLGRKRIVFWNEVRRVDRAQWLTPLLVRLTLADGRKLTLLHAGNNESSRGLLRQLYRYSHRALLDGVPYRLFWGESAQAEESHPSAVRYPLLSPEDEAAVESLYRRLKQDGHLDREVLDENRDEVHDGKRDGKRDGGNHDENTYSDLSEYDES